jgi:hypothetical protein
MNALSMKKSSASIIIVMVIVFLSATPVFAVEENNMESQAVDDVFQGASQSIIEQFPAGIAGPLTSIVSFLETFRIAQYENALVKKATLEFEYLESVEPVSSETETEEGSVSYADSISGVSFDVIVYKMQHTGWVIIVALFKYWMLFYLVGILLSVALVGKLYGLLVRK